MVINATREQQYEHALVAALDNQIRRFYSSFLIICKFERCFFIIAKLANLFNYVCIFYEAVS